MHFWRNRHWTTAASTKSWTPKCCKKSKFLIKCNHWQKTKNNLPPQAQQSHCKWTHRIFFLTTPRIICSFHQMRQDIWHNPKVLTTGAQIIKTKKTTPGSLHGQPWSLHVPGNSSTLGGLPWYHHSHQPWTCEPGQEENLLQQLQQSNHNQKIKYIEILQVKQLEETQWPKQQTKICKYHEIPSGKIPTSVVQSIGRWRRACLILLLLLSAFSLICLLLIICLGNFAGNLDSWPWPPTICKTNPGENNINQHLESGGNASKLQNNIYKHSGKGAPLDSKFKCHALEFARLRSTLAALIAAWVSGLMSLAIFTAMPDFTFSAKASRATCFSSTCKGQVLSQQPCTYWNPEANSTQLMKKTTNTNTSSSGSTGASSFATGVDGEGNGASGWAGTSGSVSCGTCVGGISSKPFQNCVGGISSKASFGTCVGAIS